MAQYRIKPTMVEASQWHKDGDHSAVAKFSHETFAGKATCECGRPYTEHGLIDARVNTGCGGLEEIVCPGAFIVLLNGEFTAMEPNNFHSYFELVEEE